MFLKKLKRKTNRPSLYLWLVTLFILAGLVFLSGKAGTYLEKSDPLQKSDAIIVLMGSIPDRVLYTADLYKQGIAPQIIIANEAGMEAWEGLVKLGVKPPVRGSEQFKLTAIQLGIPDSAVHNLPGSAKSTLQEAQIISQYFKSHPEFKTITLVSSGEHTRRASLIFRTVFKREGLHIRLMVSPSPYSAFTGRKWWTDRENAATVFYEWTKILSFVLVEQWGG